VNVGAMPWVLGERSVSYSFAVNQFEGVKRFAPNEAREAFDLKTRHANDLARCT
jgi:hypothetical protein